MVAKSYSSVATNAPGPLSKVSTTPVPGSAYLPAPLGVAIAAEKLLPPSIEYLNTAVPITPATVMRTCTA